MKPSSFCFADKKLMDALYSTGKSLSEIARRADLSRLTIARAISGERIQISKAYAIINAINELQKIHNFEFNELFKIGGTYEHR